MILMIIRALMSTQVHLNRRITIKACMIGDNVEVTGVYPFLPCYCETRVQIELAHV
jgi:hypothetical protein